MTSMAKTTTIKVPTELRDRINNHARDQGVSAAGFLGRLVEAYDRRKRMEAFGRAFATADYTYWDEFHEWDTALNDGAVRD